ncbi:MAG: Methylated-DNA--protein-cysteine methyltransferase [Candidatus Methanofastidiosum methylothiophilum]|uniref:methylated-DNA--[protein]-cysteine S-methyltransferase n=1 Tax=Candidatus Methanofastidiosum methylothiophilum TaxID=1705564 RepID=A0A150IMU2_9EURY|nr:MAG: Methylated-DNA--protein-cysteine methyltransferase [Candidatus Methanofastidiosum methylthiophilus]KYC48116.1 MAG: Methylated-DNA--protein-cysteine methyltransferase [Candidatus Methanofastidiosum methylthiophilus]KYC50645.1 MAG: Methylated-DNA--protein-cysteine methyltransferase [Candidatus Methanofastidiosum methylthiophilus]
MQNFYRLESSKLGTFGVVWKEDNNQKKVVKIFLPKNKNNLLLKIKEEYPSAKKSNSLNEFIYEIMRFLSGEIIKFNLELLDFSICTDFQKKVLFADFNIPRGYVSTYSRIAKSTGVPNGARAVGNALVTNPFPLVIPCHRVVRADGSLGGFGGGFEMKKRLLEAEGIILSKGKVTLDKIYN